MPGLAFAPPPKYSKCQHLRHDTMSALEAEIAAVSLQGVTDGLCPLLRRAVAAAAAVEAICWRALASLSCCRGSTIGAVCCLELLLSNQGYLLVPACFAIMSLLGCLHRFCALVWWPLYWTTPFFLNNSGSKGHNIS